MRAGPGRVSSVAIASIVLVLAACGEPEPPAPDVVERVVTLTPTGAGPADAASAPTLSAPLEAAGLGWITGIRVEAPEGVVVTDAGVTLDTEIDVIRASEEAPEIRFPEGLGIPVLRIRGDLPPRWRSLRVTARTIADGTARAGAPIRVVVTGSGPVDHGRLAPLWRVPIVLEGDGIRAAGTGSTATLARALDAAVPVPGTIHAVVPRTHGTAREIRIVPDADGPPIVVLPATADGAPIGAWTDPVGIRIGPDRAGRLEADVDGSPGGRVTIDVYVRPDDGAALRYPGAPDA